MDEINMKTSILGLSLKNTSIHFKIKFRIYYCHFRTKIL